MTGTPTLGWDDQWESIDPWVPDMTTSWYKQLSYNDWGYEHGDLEVREESDELKLLIVD